MLQGDAWLTGLSEASQAQQSGCFLSQRRLQQQSQHATGRLQGSEAPVSHASLARTALCSCSDEKRDERGVSRDRVSNAGVLEHADAVSAVAERHVPKGGGREAPMHRQEECEVCGGAELRPRAVNGLANSCQLRKGSCVVDYVNGGCCFLIDSSDSCTQEGFEGSNAPLASMEDAGSCEVGDGVTVVARYQETGRIAAVATQPFGEHAGRAVLCGTHPEMPGEMLLAGRHMEPPRSVRGPGAAWYKQHLLRLHQQLLGGTSAAFGDNERRREAYFRLLLQHAGLLEFLTVAARS